MSEDRVKELIKESGGGGGGSSGGYYGKYDLTLSVDGWKAVSDSEGEMPYAARNGSPIQTGHCRV